VIGAAEAAGSAGAAGSAETADAAGVARPQLNPYCGRRTWEDCLKPEKPVIKKGV
jgi:hypothetical protein